MFFLKKLIKYQDLSENTQIFANFGYIMGSNITIFCDFIWF